MDISYECENWTRTEDQLQGWVFRGMFGASFSVVQKPNYCLILSGWLADGPLVYFIFITLNRFWWNLTMDPTKKLLFPRFNFGPYRFTAVSAASAAVAWGMIILAAAVWDCKFRKHKILVGNIFSMLIALQFVPVRLITSKFIIQATVILSRSVHRRQQLTWNIKSEFWETIKDFQNDHSQGALLPFQGGALFCVFIPPPACHHKFNRHFIGFELTRNPKSGPP